MEGINGHYAAQPLGGTGFPFHQQTGAGAGIRRLVRKEDYLKFETGCFLSQYHGDSVTSLMNALAHTRKFSDKDIEDLLLFISQQGG